MMKKVEIDKNKIPNHVAVIMDGNGRWAKKKGLSREFGHKAGRKAVKNIIEACIELNIKNLKHSLVEIVMTLNQIMSESCSKEIFLFFILFHIEYGDLILPSTLQNKSS